MNKDVHNLRLNQNYCLPINMRKDFYSTYQISKDPPMKCLLCLMQRTNIVQTVSSGKTIQNIRQGV
jgi:hypothetical protein